MSSIGGNVGLLVASLDLKLVRLIRGAMPAADAQANASGPAAPAQSSQPARREIPPVERPAAVGGPPPKLRGGIDLTGNRHPSPAYNRHGLIERPQTHRHCPRIAPQCEAVTTAPPMIQPPWSTLPRPALPRPILSIHRTIKISPGRTDVRDVGQTLDIFI